MNEFAILLLPSLYLSIGAFVLSNIINQPEHILGSLDGWLNRNLPEWLYNPIIGCQWCVSGQWSLWYYLILSFITKEIDYRLDVHILFILFTIFLEEPITFFYYKVFNKNNKS